VAPVASPSATDQASEDDAIVELFRAMATLKDADTAASAARLGLEVAAHAVPCLAALVLLRDRATSDMIILHAQGPRAEQLLGTRLQGDSLVDRAARAGKPTVVTYGTEPGAEKTRCARHALFDPWSVVLVPVVHGGELLGMLEMIGSYRSQPVRRRAARCPRLRRQTPRSVSGGARVATRRLTETTGALAGARARWSSCATSCDRPGVT
jgi:hypothetical protein